MPPATSVPGSSSTVPKSTGTAETTRTPHTPVFRQLPSIRAVLGAQLDLPTARHDPWTRDSEDMLRTSPTSASSASPHFGPEALSVDATHSTPRSPSHLTADGYSRFTPSNSSATADADTVVSPPSLALPGSYSTSLPLPSWQGTFSSTHPQAPRSAPPLTSPAQAHFPSSNPTIRSTVPQPPYSAPPYSAQHVLRPSPSGELITGPSIPRRTRGTAVAAAAFGASSSAPNAASTAELRAQWERRHVCPLCNKRFNRPSSLKTHQSVHTGSRPYPCTYPGCTKTFSVASNMRRHRRKHAQESGSEHEHGGGHTHASEPAPEHTHEQDHDELEHAPTHEQDLFWSSEGSGSGSGEGEMDVDQLTEGEPHAAEYTTNTAATSAREPASFMNVFPQPPTSDTYYDWASLLEGPSLSGPGRRGTTPTGGRRGPPRASGSRHAPRTP